jgi:hypothetical protein
MALPVGYADNPVAFMDGLWNESSDARLRARFFRYEKNDGTASIDRCCAVAELGSRVLLSFLKRTDHHAIDLDLAALLQRIVDEIRFCMPTIGLGNWSILQGSLAGALSYLGLLSKPEECKKLFQHLSGDSDAEAASAVNIAANGVPQTVVAAGLAAAGVDPRRLYDEWIKWNLRGHTAGVAETPFALHLSRIADAAI